MKQNEEMKQNAVKQNAVGTVFKSECAFVTKVSRFWPVGRRNFPGSRVKI